MASVYILLSRKLEKFYIGGCADLQQGLLEHKNKIYANSYTTTADDWELYFQINDLDGEKVRKIETHIKSMKSKKYIENLKKYPEMTQKLLSKFSSD